MTDHPYHLQNALRSCCVTMRAKGKPLLFSLGDEVRKRSGSNWHGTVVGFYSSSLTDEGYAVESAFELGSVQIYPASALEKWDTRND